MCLMQYIFILMIPCACIGMRYNIVTTKLILLCIGGGIEHMTLGVPHTTPESAITDGDIIERWAHEAGATAEGSVFLRRCLEEGFLLSQPKPSRNYHQRHFSHEENLRHLWYQEAAKVLGYKYVHNYPSQILAVIRKVYMDPIFNAANAKRGVGTTGLAAKKVRGWHVGISALHR
jgi:hypothetical protein